MSSTNRDPVWDFYVWNPNLNFIWTRRRKSSIASLFYYKKKNPWKHCGADSPWPALPHPSLLRPHLFLDLPPLSLLTAAAAARLHALSSVHHLHASPLFALSSVLADLLRTTTRWGEGRNRRGGAIHGYHSRGTRAFFGSRRPPDKSSLYDHCPLVSRRYSLTRCSWCAGGELLQVSGYEIELLDSPCSRFLFYVYAGICGS